MSETEAPQPFTSETENLSWILQQCGSVYRALWPHIDPARADDLELWQIAALQKNDANTPLSDEEVNRRLIEARYKAAAEGREFDPDEIFAGMSESQVARVGAPVPTDMV